MSRNITIMALVQLLLVILGFFGLGVVMKWNGYPHEEDYGIRFTSLALLLRHHGLLLLLVPAVWAVFTALAQNRPAFIFSLDIWLVLGIVATVTIIILFLYASIHPFTRPILLYLGH